MELVYRNPDLKKKKGDEAPLSFEKGDGGGIGKVANLKFSASNKGEEIGLIIEKIQGMMEKSGVSMPENFKMSVLSKWIFEHEGVHKGAAYKQFLEGFQQEERDSLLEKLKAFKPDSEVAQSVSGVSYYLALYDALS